MNKQLKEILTADERYNNFILLDKPVCFKDLFKDLKIDVVQIHDTTIFNSKYMAGFCGAFAWKDNLITSIDNDCYTDDMMIEGYSYFETSDGEIGLDILTDEW